MIDWLDKTNIHLNRNMSKNPMDNIRGEIPNTSNKRQTNQNKKS